jgi:hypothetical protein
MRTDHESFLTPRWIVFGTALVYFALGSVLTAQFMHLKETWADNHRVFQLKIHHAVPRKMPVLEERIRCASMLQAGPGLAEAEDWVPDDARFIQPSPIHETPLSLSLFIEKSRDRGDGEWPFAIQHYVVTTGNNCQLSIGQ